MARRWGAGGGGGGYTQLERAPDLIPGGSQKPRSAFQHGRRKRKTEKASSQPSPQLGGKDQKFTQGFTLRRSRKLERHKIKDVD